MEIPEDLLNQLKCSECNELLSCGPVYILHRTGASICGRCSQQQDIEQSTGTRIGPYEATASLLAFPCAFAVHGCPEKLPFSLGPPSHELDCKFRPFTCPIAASTECNWRGPCFAIKDHCDEAHTSNILENPGNPPLPDLTTTNLHAYLISAFNYLFLLQMKVCLASGKMYHSVRMFGDADHLDKFAFKLDVDGNNMKLSKSGAVLRAGRHHVDEPTLVYTTINCLLSILGGNESTFTMRIRPLFNYCANCFKEIENAPAPDDDAAAANRFCGECAAKLQKCHYHEMGCSFVDIYKKKCSKHEHFFCKHQTKCKCDVDFAGGTFFDHLESSSSCRKTSKSNIDATFRLTRNIDKNKKIVLLSSKDFDCIICEYTLADNKLLLSLYTSLPVHDLKDLKCSIKLCDPLTKFSQILTPPFVADKWRDWCIDVSMYDFASWRKHGTDIKINIRRK